VVVTGYDPEPIAAMAQANCARVIHNPDHEKGMTTSFQAGLRAVENIDAVYLVLGDQLGLRPELLRRMAVAMENIPNALIVSPVHGGKRGHPVLFRSNLFSEILATKGTLKEVVDGHAEAHAFIEGEEWSTLDFDTPRDFEHAKKLFEMHD
jgi:molybdenum cofactor cytidylyltransferase